MWWTPYYKETTKTDTQIKDLECRIDKLERSMEKILNGSKPETVLGCMTGKPIIELPAKPSFYEIQEAFMQDHEYVPEDHIPRSWKKKEKK